MSSPIVPTPMAWLPDHQLHVVDSLGHIDDQMQIVAELLQKHSRAGTFDLRNDVVGARMLTSVFVFSTASGWRRKRRTQAASRSPPPVRPTSRRRPARRRDGAPAPLPMFGSALNMRAHEVSIVPRPASLPGRSLH